MTGAAMIGMIVIVLIAMIAVAGNSGTIAANIEESAVKNGAISAESFVLSNEAGTFNKKAAFFRR